MEIAEILCLAMFVVTCGFLMLGFPVAFTLAGTSIFFAAMGVATDVFTWSLFGALPSRILEMR